MYVCVFMHGDRFARLIVACLVLFSLFVLRGSKISQTNNRVATTHGETPPPMISEKHVVNLMPQGPPWRCISTSIAICFLIIIVSPWNYQAKHTYCPM